MSRERDRVGVVATGPTQWETPFFRHLRTHSALDPYVFYGSRLGLGDEVESESGIRVHFDLPELLEGHDYAFVGPGENPIDAFERVHGARPLDAMVVEGHVGRLQRAALAWTRRRRVPAIYRSDSTLLYRMPAWKKVAKRMLLPLFFRRFPTFLPLSTPAADYLRHYGVGADRIFVSPYMLDHDWYAAEAARWRASSRALRVELALDRFDHVVLAILRFEDRENPLEFLRAAASLKGSRPGLGFVLIGDGRRASTVREFVEREHLDQVVLPGYLPLSSLPRYYAVADVFVHPAVEECWGLSVNEAMASSVPVVVSTGVGCRFDLLPSSEFGLVYPLGNGKALVEAILALVDDPERARAVAARAKERVAGYGYALAAESFERAVRRARRAPGSATGTEAT